jgi:hypothetical protein
MENALGFLSQLSDSQTNRTWVVYKTAVIPNDALIWIEDEKEALEQSNKASLQSLVSR